MKMEHKQKNKSKIKRLSDYIMSFAFLYSSFICFNEGINRLQNEKVLGAFILFCGFLSFIAVFRWQIANIIYFLQEKYKNAKK